MANTATGTPSASSDEPSDTIALKVTDTERINYQKAAERCGLSLAEWMRDRLNTAAQREAKET
jgi:hypothetical protein